METRTNAGTVRRAIEPKKWWKHGRTQERWDAQSNQQSDENTDERENGAKDLTSPNFQISK